MSTPSGKPLNPIDPSARVSHETHERAGPERHPVENDRDPLQSRAPTKARAQPAGELDFAINEDAPPLAPLRASEDLREHPERSPLDVHEPYLFSHDAADGP